MTCRDLPKLKLSQNRVEYPKSIYQQFHALAVRCCPAGNLFDRKILAADLQETNIRFFKGLFSLAKNLKNTYSNHVEIVTVIFLSPIRIFKFSIVFNRQFSNISQKFYEY